MRCYSVQLSFYTALLLTCPHWFVLLLAAACEDLHCGGRSKVEDQEGQLTVAAREMQ